MVKMCWVTTNSCLRLVRTHLCRQLKVKTATTCLSTVRLMTFHKSKACEGARTGAVIGGGLLGLEAANALKLLGLETHVIEFAPRLMPVQLDDGAGLVLKRRLKR